ncbi:unnamed protein product [Hydatigera taeniaeformis]|uniref:EGF-like domain-containing protein n=1 Tax=Hydatigena taeniaeformis TaxID=6205 RepID=A0A0R3WSM4_HYDTA|nr:unnamed protein product [Hydatigera taeniaeformis]
MFTSTHSMFVLVLFFASFLLVNSRLIVTECPSGTPTCSHGRCVQRIGWDEESQPVNEQRCICDPDYYGEACDLLVVSDFRSPVIISPDRVNVFALDELDAPAIPDRVNEKHAYGGAA